MNAFSLKYAKENLEKVVQEAVDRGDGVFIATYSGETVVLLSLEEWSSMKETAHLMRFPANREHLLESMAELRSGQMHIKELSELVGDEARG